MLKRTAAKCTANISNRFFYLVITLFPSLNRQYNKYIIYINTIILIILNYGDTIWRIQKKRKSILQDKHTKLTADFYLKIIIDT